MSSDNAILTTGIVAITFLVVGLITLTPIITILGIVLAMSMAIVMMITIACHRSAAYEELAQLHGGK